MSRKNGLKVIARTENNLLQLGGAKVGDKILLIENLMIPQIKSLLVEGMVYTFLFAAWQGFKIGNSLCETEKLDLALELLVRAKSFSRHRTARWFCRRWYI